MPDDPLVPEVIPAELAPTVAGLSDEGIDLELAYETSDDQPETRWRIDDDATAEWALRVLAGAQRRYAELEDLRAAWVDKITRWFDDASRAPADRIRFFEGHLGDYLLRRRAEDPKLKSLNLPSGSLRSRETKPTTALADEDAAIAWLEATLPFTVADTIIKRETKVLVGELRKAVTATPYPDAAVAAADAIAACLGAIFGGYCPPGPGPHYGLAYETVDGDTGETTTCWIADPVIAGLAITATKINPTVVTHDL